MCFNSIHASTPTLTELSEHAKGIFVGLSVTLLIQKIYCFWQSSLKVVTDFSLSTHPHSLIYLSHLEILWNKKTHHKHDAYMAEGIF